MEKKIKAAGYVRVSTPGQEDGESLSTQRKNIEFFARKENLELVQIYADEGISGGSVSNRHGLLQCLKDGVNGKFSVIIIHRLSRFGRNALELLNNYKELQKAGIQLRSISEGIDFSTKYGEFMLTMLAAIAQLEREIIRETMLENRIGRAKRGIPTAGMMPFGRTFDREKGVWILDEEKAKIIRQAAQEYLDGIPMKALARKYGMRDNNLRIILGQKSGDTWTVNFKDAEPITYIIPRILPDETIARLRERFEFNKKNNRNDIITKYLLSGYIFCEKCHRPLTAQTPNKDHSYLKYYRHRPDVPCKAFTYIPTQRIEEAVFQAIFENFVDVPNFEKAIAESLPDPTTKTDIELRIAKNRKRINKLDKDLDDLVNLALSGTLTRETIQKKETELIHAKSICIDEISNDQRFLQSLPDIEQVKEEANSVRRLLLDYFGSKEHQTEMTYEDKRKLLQWLFEGRDKEGNNYGIYINATRQGKKQKVDYFLYGKITGLRTMVGDNYDYNEEEEGFLDLNPHSKHKRKDLNIDFKIRNGQD